MKGNSAIRYFRDSSILCKEFEVICVFTQTFALTVLTFKIGKTICESQVLLQYKIGI